MVRTPLRHFGTVLFVAACLPLPLPAQTPDCTSPVTQLDMNLCADQSFRAADAALNATWPAAKAAADASGAGEALLDAQRKWLAYRDAACTAEAMPYAGGSIQPLIWSGCLAKLTERRTEDLATFVQ